MRLAVLSDIHSNSVALNAVLNHAFSDGQCESVLFLGDLLGYGPDPISVLETAKSKFRWMVLGNHDALFFELTHLLENAADEVITTYNDNKKSINKILNEAQEACANPYTKEYVAAMQNVGRLAKLIEERHKDLSATNGYAIDSILRNIVRVQAAQYEFEWYRSLYKDAAAFGEKVIEIDGLKLVFVHGTLNDPKGEYLFPWQCFGGNTFLLRHAQLLKAYDKYGDDQLCVFSGHTHVPLYLQVDDSAQRDSEYFRNKDLEYGKPLQLGRWVTLINPGSVGKPRDNDPRAAYAVVDTDTDKKTVEYLRIKYDIPVTSQDMRTQYFDKELIEQLKKAQTPNDIPGEAYDLLSERKRVE